MKIFFLLKLKHFKLPVTKVINHTSGWETPTICAYCRSVQHVHLGDNVHVAMVSGLFEHPHLTLHHYLLSSRKIKGNVRVSFLLSWRLVWSSSLLLSFVVDQAPLGPARPRQSPPGHSKPYACLSSINADSKLHLWCRNFSVKTLSFLYTVLRKSFWWPSSLFLAAF